MASIASRRAPQDDVLQTIEAFAPAGDRYQLLGARPGAESVLVPPFEELEFDLASVWAQYGTRRGMLRRLSDECCEGLHGSPGSRTGWKSPRPKWLP